MPSKSRHGKGKRPQTRNRARQPQTAAVNQSAATAPGASVPVPAKTVPARAASKVVAYAPASAAEYPFFSSELKRITIITAVILVVLIVLALIIR